MSEFIQPNSEETAKVDSFMKDLKLDGTVMSLDKVVAEKELSLMIRHITYPFDEIGYYAKYHEEEESLLLFNIFGEEGVLVNVGFIDWEIKDEIAQCENIQKFIYPQNPHEALAVSEFGHPLMMNSYMVYQDYTKAGIGTFLAALSISTLNKLGVQQIKKRGNGISRDARSIWSKFDLEIPKQSEILASIPLLASHSSVTAGIAEFI